jgi:hypothetical protein
MCGEFAARAFEKPILTTQFEGGADSNAQGLGGCTRADQVISGAVAYGGDRVPFVFLIGDDQDRRITADLSQVRQQIGADVSISAAEQDGE